jgi:hypothetical protein
MDPEISCCLITGLLLIYSDRDRLAPALQRGGLPQPLGGLKDTSSATSTTSLLPATKKVTTPAARTIGFVVGKTTPSLAKSGKEKATAKTTIQSFVENTDDVSNDRLDV